MNGNANHAANVSPFLLEEIHPKQILIIQREIIGVKVIESSRMME